MERLRITNCFTLQILCFHQKMPMHLVWKMPGDWVTWSPRNPLDEWLWTTLGDSHVSTTGTGGSSLELGGVWLTWLLWESFLSPSALFLLLLFPLSPLSGEAQLSQAQGELGTCYIQISNTWPPHSCSGFYTLRANAGRIRYMTKGVLTNVMPFSATCPTYDIAFSSLKLTFTSWIPRVWSYYYWIFLEGSSCYWDDTVYFAF